jgi:hypothetical protein
MPEPIPTPDLAGLEAALKELTPASVPLDRDRLLFRAGQASVQGRRWLWPSVAGLFALTTIGLAAALALRPAPGVVERTIVVRVPVPAPPAPPIQPGPRPAPSPGSGPERQETLSYEPRPNGYLRLRNEVLRWGVEALPGPLVDEGPGLPRPAQSAEINSAARRPDLSDLLPGLSWLNFGGNL